MATVAVLGPGGVGGFIAAALARERQQPDAAASARGDRSDPAALAHERRPDVVVVAREQTAALVAREGIRVRSAAMGDFCARPAAVSRLAAGEAVQTLIVATKANGLAQALERIEAEPQLIVPLLNGLEHMAILRERFGRGRVAAGAIRIESDRPAPGVIKQTSPSLRIDLAAQAQPARELIGALAERLRSAELPVRIESSEEQVLWSKLVRLCALALNTAASDQPIGWLRSDPQARARLQACVREAVAVGRAHGAQLSAEATMAELDGAHPQLGSSMQRDIAAGNQPELDPIAGALLRAGASHGLACPTIAALAVQIAARTGAPLRLPGAGAR